MTGDGPSAALLGRLRPGESVLIHHRPEPGKRRVWRVVFLALFLGLLAVATGVVALVAPDLLAAAWWAPILGGLVVAGWIWLVFRVDAATAPRREVVVTERRVLWANGAELPLAPGQRAVASGNAVRLYSGYRVYRLSFPGQGQVLAEKLNEIISRQDGARA